MELKQISRRRKNVLTGQEKQAVCDRAWQAYDKGDTGQAFSLFLELAEKGYAKAQTALGILFRSCEQKQDPDQALIWLQKAAEQNDPPAFAHLGKLYQDGFGVEKDEVRAVSCYEKGAALWDDVSFLALGCCYAQGIGVKADSFRALGYLLIAGEMDNPDAALLLDASMGDEAYYDLIAEQMIPYHEQRAKQGDDVSMLVLSLCHLHGFWTEEDQEKARSWAEQGAHKGVKACRKMLDEMDKA